MKKRPAKKVKKKPRSRFPTTEVMILTDLEQLKVLADPLRVQILESLAEEHTTKQVAERLGEKPTKLYHHVDALKRVGLIKLTRTRRNRGTLEKYYQAAALSFRPDPSLFPKSALAGPEHPMNQVVLTLLEKARDELGAVAAELGGAYDLEQKGVLTLCEVRADQKQIDMIRQKIMDLLEGLTKIEECDPALEKRFRLLIAYYPLTERMSRS